jgi:hypothetical protein
MPFFALANWNWGGRLHPLYYNLSIVTKALLGLAIMVCRLVVLQHSAHPDDQEKGFVGNTILLTQPRPEEIMQSLPPSNAEVSRYLSVCFNKQTMTPSDVGKHRALEIDPEEYIRCSELRKKVCPVFADVLLDAQLVRTTWPERAVPTAILQGQRVVNVRFTETMVRENAVSMFHSSVHECITFITLIIQNIIIIINVISIVIITIIVIVIIVTSRAVGRAVSC